MGTGDKVQDAGGHTAFPVLAGPDNFEMLAIKIDPDWRMPFFCQGSADTDAKIVRLGVSDNIVWHEALNARGFLFVALYLKELVYFR